MKRYFSTGQLEVITFENFENMIPETIVDNTEVRWVEVLSYNETQKVNVDTMRIQEKRGYCEANFCSKKDMFEACAHKTVPNLDIPLMDHLQDELLDRSEQYYEPRYMVNIGTRLWLMANPEDFILFRYKGFSKLACIHPSRNIIIDYK